MKNLSLMLSAGCAFLVMTGMAEPSATLGYSRIVSHLDVGGDYLEVVNAESLQRDVDAVFDIVLDIGTEFGELKKSDLRTIRSVRDSLADCGLLSTRGSGTSVMPLRDGTYRHRSFLLTEQGRNPLLDLFSCRTRAANVENYLPRSTAAALSFSMDVKSTVLAAAGVVDKFNPVLGRMIGMLANGTSQEAVLVNGFVPGTMVAMTFDMDRPFRIPGQAISFPMPGMLVAQAVKNDQIWMLMKSSLPAFASSADITCSQMPSADFPDVERLVFTLPDDEAREMNIVPACAYDRRGGVILFATSPDLLGAVLAAGLNKRDRLLDEPVFRAAVGDSFSASGLFYLSPKVVPIVVDVVQQTLRNEKASLPPTVRRLLDNPPPFWLGGTFARLPDGVKTEYRASFGAGNTLRMLFGGSTPSVLGGMGVLSGALFPAISSAMQKAQTTAAASNGRKLYVAIQEANVSREANGMKSVWPKSSDDRDENAEDIAEMEFASSTKYFDELFDVKNYGTKDHRPYVGDPDLSVLKLQGAKALSAATGRRLTANDVDWCVLKGLRDGLEDCIPVLVSANVNVRDLITSGEFDGKSTRRVRLGRANGAAKDLFGNKFCIFVHKGGAVQIVESKYTQLKQIYRNTPFSVPSDAKLEYLKP